MKAKERKGENEWIRYQEKVESSFSCLDSIFSPTTPSSSISFILSFVWNVRLSFCQARVFHFRVLHGIRFPFIFILMLHPFWTSVDCDEERHVGNIFSIQEMMLIILIPFFSFLPIKKWWRHWWWCWFCICIRCLYFVLLWKPSSSGPFSLLLLHYFNWIVHEEITRKFFFFPDIIPTSESRNEEVTERNEGEWDFLVEKQTAKECQR